jgi:hypothetical protein
MWIGKTGAGDGANGDATPSIATDVFTGSGGAVEADRQQKSGPLTERDLTCEQSS